MDMTRIGYARVSSTDQGLALQIERLKAAGCEMVRSEKVTGSTRQGRSELASIISFLRKGRTENEVLLFVCNFTPMTHHNYRLGAPGGGFWAEVMNGDAHLYGGSGQGNIGGVEASPLPVHGRPWSLSITVPPLATVVFKRSRN